MSEAIASTVRRPVHEGARRAADPALFQAARSDRL